MVRTIVGVMGPGDNATSEECNLAFELGKLIASKNWVLLTGGRSVGVMEAASRGAREAGGLTIGILPSEDNTNTSPFVDIPIYTGMGSARNNINVLSSQVVIVCGLGYGTLSEIALALKNNKPVILLRPASATKVFLQQLDNRLISFASSPADAIVLTDNFI